MGRLIDAEACDEGIVEEAVFKVRHGEQAVARGLLLARKYIMDASTVDAVEVVRCQNCRYWLTGICYNVHIGHVKLDTDFCSYGERKDGSKNDT